MLGLQSAMLGLRSEHRGLDSEHQGLRSATFGWLSDDVVSQARRSEKLIDLPAGRFWPLDRPCVSRELALCKRGSRAKLKPLSDVAFDCHSGVNHSISLSIWPGFCGYLAPRRQFSLKNRHREAFQALAGEHLEKNNDKPSQRFI
jgi:hypothetical protein